MIEFCNISKSFKKQNIFSNLSGTMMNGKVNLIIGLSGEGKSVLLKCLVGLFEPEEGAIFFDKRLFSSSDKNLQREIRKEIGMLFQGGALFDSMTTEENVRFPLDMFTKMTDQEKRDRVNFCLERVGLAGANTKMPSELSGGMKKRAGIARAIVNKPKYLFCDEPNSGLDPKTGIKVDELIQEITYEYDMTTVVVTHDTNSIATIGDYIFYLKSGKKVWDGTSSDIISRPSDELKDFLFSGKLSNLIFRA